MTMIGKDWYEWDSWQEFNAWHDDKKQELGYPLYPVNQATGEIDYEATPTTAYTVGEEVNGKVIAIVEDEHASGLTKTVLRLTYDAPDYKS